MDGADLPLLDAMRHRVGDPAEPGRRRHRESGLAAQRAYMDDLVDYLLATDDDPDSGLQLLRRASIRDDLVDEDAVATRRRRSARRRSPTWSSMKLKSSPMPSGRCCCAAAQAEA